MRFLAIAILILGFNFFTFALATADTATPSNTGACSCSAKISALPGTDTIFNTYCAAVVPNPCSSCGGGEAQCAKLLSTPQADCANETQNLPALAVKLGIPATVIGLVKVSNPQCSFDPTATPPASTPVGAQPAGGTTPTPATGAVTPQTIFSTGANYVAPTGGGGAVDTCGDDKSCLPIDPLGLNSDKPIQSLVARVINAMFGIAGSIALFMFVAGGFMWLISRGNSKFIDRGKGIFVWSSLGLIVMFSSYVILNFIFSNLTGTSGIAGGPSGQGAASAGGAAKWCCLDSENKTATTVDKESQCVGPGKNFYQGACDVDKSYVCSIASMNACSLTVVADPKNTKGCTSTAGNIAYNSGPTVDAEFKQCLSVLTSSANVTAGKVCCFDPRIGNANGPFVTDRLPDDCDDDMIALSKPCDPQKMMVCFKNNACTPLEVQNTLNVTETECSGGVLNQYTAAQSGFLTDAYFACYKEHPTP